MFALMLLSATLAQNVSIGSGLSDGLALVYQSGGVAQAPWVYDSVRVVEREGFERCVRVARRDQPVRETCIRDNTLFERTDAGQSRATRPIGPGMRLEVVTAPGQVMLYETGSLTSRRVADTVDVLVLPTTITTRDKDGVPVRRLREEYAPALLTALRGEFEEPDGNGGWRKIREFSLSEIRQPLRVYLHSHGASAVENDTPAAVVLTPPCRCKRSDPLAVWIPYRAGADRQGP